MIRILRLLLPLLAAAPAVAVPHTLVVDPLATHLTLGLDSAVGSASTDFDLSGSVASELTLSAHPSFGQVATGIQLLQSSLDAAHDPLQILDAGTTLTFSGSDLLVEIASPLVVATPVASGFSVGDFRNGTATFGGGTFSVAGNVLTQPIDETIDLAQAQLLLTLPINSIGQIFVAQGGGPLDVTATLPIDASTQLFVAGFAIDVSLQGNLALVSIPEPGTGLLLAMGLLLTGLGRRRPAT